MTTETTSVAEITTAAINLLCREIGPVNTARFLGQFTAGSGKLHRGTRRHSGRCDRGSIGQRNQTATLVRSPRRNSLIQVGVDSIL